MRDSNEFIILNDVLTVTVRVPNEIIEKYIIKSCLSNSFNDINNTANYIISEGYPVSMICLIYLVDNNI